MEEREEKEEEKIKGHKRGKLREGGKQPPECGKG